MESAAGHAPEATRRRAAARRLAGLVIVLAIGFGARSIGSRQVFAPDGVRFAADGDTYYHALRSERLARDWPRVPWRDGHMNYPYGAEVPWPPLLDQLIAGASLATGSRDSEHLAAVAAWMAPILSLAWISLVALLGAILLGGGPWLDAALLVALLPAAVRHGVVGRPDHHVLEATLFAAVCVAYGSALRRPSPGWAWAALLGAALALSFWNWPGSALYLLVLALHVGALHLVEGGVPSRPASLALARGAGIASVLLVGLVGSSGPPGALGRGALTPVSGLAPLLCAGTAASAGILGAMSRWRPLARWPERGAQVLAVAALPLAAVLALSAAGREGVRHGLVALGASNSWFGSIGEFAPSLFSATAPWPAEVRNFVILFGLAPVLGAFAAVSFRREWRAKPELRAALSFFATSCGLLFGLALVRRRFDVYAVAPLALCAAWALRELASRAARLFRSDRWARTIGLLGLVLAVAPGLPTVASGELSSPPPGEDKVPLLRWLRGVPPPEPGREAVMSEWSYGHEIQWFARKPVVSTPFGTEIDMRSFGDAAAFFLSSDPPAAEALLRRRGVGFVFLASPVEEAALMLPYAPREPAPVAVGYGLDRGRNFQIREPFGVLVPSRLFYFDGGWPSGEGAALDAYRLIAESPERVQVLTVTTQRFKLFELVDGARLRVQGADPGAWVAAAILVRTNAGREFPWTTGAPSDAGGVAILRIPYATGANGLAAASPCTVIQGNRARQVLVPERAVLAGEEVVATLP